MNHDPKRGEVWLAVIPDLGRRPVIVVTRDAVLPHLSRLTIVPVTRTARGIDTEVELTPGEHGVPTRSVASCDNLTTIEKAWLVRRITTLDTDAMNALSEAIHVALDLPW